MFIRIYQIFFSIISSALPRFVLFFAFFLSSSPVHLIQLCCDDGVLKTCVLNVKAVAQCWLSDVNESSKFKSNCLVFFSSRLYEKRVIECSCMDSQFSQFSQLTKCNYCVCVGIGSSCA